MALELRQTQRLAQQLVMTPQLQQAIKLLQLSRLELTQTIQLELRENPFLEEMTEGEDVDAAPGEPNEPEPEVPAADDLAPDAEAEAPVRSIEASTEGDELPLPDDLGSLQRYFEEGTALPRSSFTDDEERPSLQSMLTKTESLADHLLWQLRMGAVPVEDQPIGLLLIGNIDEDGYLRATLAEIAAEAKTTEEHVAGVLAFVHDMDPPGVGARDLVECLCLQLRLLGVSDPLAATVVREHLHALERREFERIARATSRSIDDVKAAAHIIAGLEPKPGRPFAVDPTPYITPDVYIEQVDDEYRIVLNDDGLPRLRINAFYQRYLALGDRVGAAEAKEYLQERLRMATWLIKSIQQRQRTIYRVVESIVKFQRGFLDRGIQHLKPLVLREVAQDIGMHESTVSRVTSNKYVQTPRGLYELKFFFTSGVPGADGDRVAAASVKALLTQFIAAEDPAHPLSDQTLVQRLRERGIHVARRTVTKYRETMGVPPSTERRRAL